MKFASLGSGSKGNATLVEDNSCCILIDCGFSVRETERRLSLQGCPAEDLTAILVTHEHSDHIRGAIPLAKKYNLPVYMTAGAARTQQSIQCDVNLIQSDTEFQCGTLSVMPVSVPHDAKEPVQFILSNGKHRLGVLTDLGHISNHVAEQYKNCDGLLLEANHDPLMLANGPYPQSLKQRVGGDWGHLNNYQSRQLLEHIETGRLQHLVLGHISEQNNQVDKVREVVAGMHLNQVHYASQGDGFEWLELL